MLNVSMEIALIDPAYVIFGVKGLIGKSFHDKLMETVPDHKVFSFAHELVDINSKQEIRRVIEYVKPDIVINCASVSDPEICEKAASGAFETNSVGPRIIAEQCNKFGAKLVHFSTSSVFSRNRHKPYSERCKPCPVGTYGKSKADGERVIQETSNDYLIIRPGWLFHSTSSNFLMDWIGKMDRGLNVHFPPDVHGSPTFIPDLIDVTRELIDRDASGIFHVANSNAATWEQVATVVKEMTKSRSRLVGIPERTMAMLPPIPQYTVLSSKKAKRLVGQDMRPWKSALKQCLFQMERYKP